MGLTGKVSPGPVLEGMEYRRASGAPPLAQGGSLLTLGEDVATEPIPSASERSVLLEDGKAPVHLGEGGGGGRGEESSGRNWTSPSSKHLWSLCSVRSPDTKVT